MRWRSTLNQHLRSGEEKFVNVEVGKRAHRKERNSSNRQEATHKCNSCGRDCFSHIGLSATSDAVTIRQGKQDVLPWSNLIDGSHRYIRFKIS